MSEKIYINEYNQVEKCYNCNQEYIFKEVDPCEPLEVYQCSCGKVKYKSIGDYEG